MSAIELGARRRVLPIAKDVELELAALSLRADVGSARGGVAMTTPVSIHRRGGARPESHPVRRPTAYVAAALTRRTTRDHQEDDMNGQETVSSALSRADAIANALHDAARGEVAVGPVTVGDRTVVPLAETFFAGGYGGGFGDAPEGAASPGSGGGAGGGGVGRSRTVAVVIAGPDGVDVRPIVDTTAITLAAIGALLGVLGVARRRRR